MSDVRKLTAIVGQPLQIVLQSHVGSTGYGWYLSELDGGIVLSDSCVHPSSHMPGAASSHSFDFLAVKAGSFKAVFQMIAPWRPSEPAQTETYEIEIKAPEKTPEADIDAAMKSDEFVGPKAAAGDTCGPTVLKYATPMASPVLKYAAPMASSTHPVLKYAAPIMVEYAAPMAATAAPQETAPAHLPCPPYHYSHPDPRILNPQVTILYAAPVTAGGSHPQPMYAAPIPQPHTVYPMYAAPLHRAYPVYAAPPSVMPPYAAPYTSDGCC
ncbi:MAG: protease inhibitor I42 family protein [Desulfobacterales bacterium]|nr:protease inhibitor I42 family protein [Desulfobacterales bacterium]